MIKVSVVVPVYNVEKYLVECIESIINQTLKDIEIILINDNSKDSSNEICKEFLKMDSRISLYQCNGEGVSVARNIGIHEAKGEWIAFVDSDDWLEENMLEELYKISMKRKSDIIMCDSYVNMQNEQKINEFYDREKIFIGKEKEKLQIQAVNPIDGVYRPQFIACGVPWAKLYKREFIIDKNLKYKKNLPRRQDMIFNLEAFEKANEINYKKNKLYHYRKNEKSKVNRFESNICYEYNNIIYELKNFMSIYKKDDVLEKSYNEIIIEYYKAYNKYFFSKENTKSIDEKLNMYSENLNKEEYRQILEKIPKMFKLKFFCFLFRNKCKKTLNFITFFKNIKKLERK